MNFRISGKSPAQAGLFFGLVLTADGSRLIQSRMDEIIRYRHCFVCGDQNRHGLKARFYYDGRQAVSEVTAEEDFEGYRGIYHGGIITALLDEVMIKAILALGICAVTAEMNVKFTRPVRTGEKLRLAGSIRSSKGRLYITEGTAVNEAGNICATAGGKYLEAGPQLGATLTESICRD